MEFIPPSSHGETKNSEKDALDSNDRDIAFKIDANKKRKRAENVGYSADMPMEVDDEEEQVAPRRRCPKGRCDGPLPDVFEQELTSNSFLMTLQDQKKKRGEVTLRNCMCFLKRRRERGRSCASFVLFLLQLSIGSFVEQNFFVSWSFWL